MLRAFGESAPVHVVWFSSVRKLAEGFYLDGEEIFYAHDGNTEKVINVNDLNLLGRHNYENVMAATAMSVNFGVPMEKIVEVLKRFQAVEHRIEYVTEKRGVRFYNDSKGTNPDAAIQGIRAMNRPTLLIGGGYDKQSTYDEWIDAFDGKVKKTGADRTDSSKKLKCVRISMVLWIPCAVRPLRKRSVTAMTMQYPGMRFCFHRHVPAGACSRTMRSVDGYSKKSFVD